MNNDLHLITIDENNKVSVILPTGGDTMSDLLKKIPGSLIYDGPVYDFSMWDPTTKSVVEDVQEKFEDALNDWKEERDQKVLDIKVTTSKGYMFDGNEVAQTRMTRALLGLSDGVTMPWVLSDDSVAMVDRGDLMEALYLSGTEQARLWVDGRPTPPE
jgi:hypothetical protein